MTSESEKDGSRVNGREVEKLIGWRDVLKPAGVVTIPFGVLVNAAAEQSIGPGHPIIYSVLLVALVTFSYRAIWLARRCGTHVLVCDAKSFTPERFAFLGFVIATVTVMIAFMTGQTIISSDSTMTEWVAGLLTTVPLLEVFGGSWGQLQARPISSDENGDVADRGLENRIGIDSRSSRSESEIHTSKPIETWMGSRTR